MLGMNSTMWNASRWPRQKSDCYSTSISKINQVRVSNTRTAYEHSASCSPLVTVPLKVGFGSRLIQRHVAAAFGGKAQITFGTEGITYEISPLGEEPS